MDWTAEQLAELSRAGQRHPTPHIRVKALAVQAVARGQRPTAVAAMFATTRQSVSSWVKAYRAEGLSGFAIAPGRGRPREVDEAELKRYATQSPRNFGIARTRWTLELLTATVPSLKGFSIAGVRQALLRCGLAYKRGQPWMLSPDPAYEKKG